MKTKISKKISLGLGLFFILGIGVVFALNTWSTGYQVLNGTPRSVLYSSASYNICEVKNSHSNGLAAFVPTKTTAEWLSFWNNTPAGIIAKVGVKSATTCDTDYYEEGAAIPNIATTAAYVDGHHQHDDTECDTYQSYRNSPLNNYTNGTHYNVFKLYSPTALYGYINFTANYSNTQVKENIKVFGQKAGGAAVTSLFLIRDFYKDAGTGLNSPDLDVNNDGTIDIESSILLENSTWNGDRNVKMPNKFYFKVGWNYFRVEHPDHYCRTGQLTGNGSVSFTQVWISSD